MTDRPTDEHLLLTPAQSSTLRVTAAEREAVDLFAFEVAESLARYPIVADILARMEVSE